MDSRDTPDEDNQRLESRVRENRQHGSEGGEANNLPDPYRWARPEVHFKGRWYLNVLIEGFL